jgi:hypothetical protein
MLARAAGLSMAISNEHSAKPFAATIAKNGYLVFSTWYLAFKTPQAFFIRRRQMLSLQPEYQVPNTFIPLRPLWLSSLASADC